MAIPFSHVDTLFMKVTNVEKAIEWYTKVLDCKTIWHNAEGGFASINILGLPITLVQEKEDVEFVPSNNAPFNIYVNNIEEAHGFLKDRDVAVGEIETLYNVEWFWFTDIDGNRLEVCNYQK